MSSGIYIYLDEGDDVQAERVQAERGRRYPEDLTVRIGNNLTLYLRRTTAAALHAALGDILNTPADETE